MQSTNIDETDKQQIKEHIRTLEYAFEELDTQHTELTLRMERLVILINKEKQKLKEYN